MRPTLLALLLIAAPAFSQERTHAVTPEDFASVAAITQFAVSPDGKQVAYCEARWDKADDLRKTDLWLVATDGKRSPRRLTGERANDRSPKWGVDGDAVYVLANRKRAGETKPPYDGSTQVWRVPADGDDPQPVTKVPGGVIAFDYAPLGGAIFYTVDATATDDDEFAKLRAAHPAEYGHGTRKVSEVWRLDLQSWRAEKVIAEGRYVREFAVTRDGKRVAMITAADDTVIRSEGGSRVDVWDKETGKVTPTDMTWMKTAASPYPWLESLTISPNGTRVAFCTVFDAHPAEIVVIEPTPGLIGSSSVNRLSRPEGVHIRGYGSPLRWKDDSELMFLGEKSGQVSLYSADRGNGRVVSVGNTGNGVVSGVEFSSGGSAYAALSGGEKTFAGLSIINLSMPSVSHVPIQPTEGWKLPTVEHITWTAPDGSKVGGVLELPPGYTKGDKLPLVVAIHGGPTTSSKAELNFDPHNGRLYLAAAGYAVLCPNYRGSTGYGDKFVTDLIGRENDVEVNDIIAGVQHLVKEGIADPDRVGVMGWSNGGYLTNCLITRKELPFKLKAASSGAGIVDTVAEWGFNDEPAYPVVFKKGLPWEQPDIYRKTSPTYALGNVTTPTLIHVGGGDERCPPGHSRMLYRALKENAKVPTELVVYPGEPHGLTKLSHRTAKMAWDLAWFDKYLRGGK